MGKEQALLDAARCGNLLIVERILKQRTRKSGPLASLRRGLGANTQDPSGYTPLHHSVLNGHRDVVALLLRHEASTNAVDNKGSTPLHLAAWTGNTEIVKLLLTHEPSVPDVNHVNHDHETALHSAAQYGHNDVVTLLLQNKCDPSIRNLKDETALDLAAQYGRFDAVEQLIKYCPQLLQNNIKQHSPLHLAARNGHKQVVKILLDAGFSLDVLTDNGTALHEAAFSGKNDVVRLLLHYATDLHLKDQHGRTVLRLLEELDTKIAKKTLQIIQDHTTLVATDDQVSESPCSLSPPPGFMSGIYANFLQPERISSPSQSCSPLSEINFYEVPSPPKAVGERWSVTSDQNLTPPFSKSYDSDLYHTPPSSGRSDQNLTPPFSKSHDSDLYHMPPSSGRSDQNLTPPFSKSHDSDLYNTPPSSGRSSSSPYETPPPHREIDTFSKSTTHQSTPEPGESPVQPTRFFPSSNSEPVWYEIPSPGNKYCDPTKNNSSTCQESKLGDEDSVGTFSCTATSTSNYISMTQLKEAGGSMKLQPPAKPPRRPTVTTISPSNKLHRTGSDSIYEYLCLATSGREFAHPARGGEEYVDMKLRSSIAENYENTNTVLADSTDGASDDKVVNLENPQNTEKCVSDVSNVNSLSDMYVNIPLVTDRGRFESATTLRKYKMFTSSYENLPPSINAKAKPNSHDFRRKRTTVQIPLNPTNYALPPTSDFSRHSSPTAKLRIHEKMRPLSQDELSDRPPEANEEYQSSKCGLFGIDTDNEIVTTFDTEKHTGVALEADKKPVSADNIEEIIDDDPFAGLFRGSLCPTNCSDDFKISFHVSNTKLTPPPPPPRRTAISRRSRNIYENVGIKMESGGRSRPNLQDSSEGGRDDNRNSLSVMSPFDENAEWAEIADIMASFGSGIARESVFSNEMEEHFTNVLTLEASKKVEEKKFKTVEEWLSHLRLSDYENLFLINGFDDIEFLGGNILEDQDLQEIGISNEEHRERILNFSKKLQPIQPIGKDEGKIRMPESVNHWLKLLHLEEYQDTFQKNGFTNMDRVMKIWEVELNTVLEIKKLGHQKRILASLGERTPEQYMDNLEDFDLSKLNSKLSELGIEEAPSTEVCKEDAGLFKDYTNVTSTRRENKGSQSLTQTLSGDKGELRIRPPTQLMSEQEYVETSSSRQQISGVPACLTAQWCHQPDALIKGHCIYKAQYLGSTLIKELKGLESTRKSIQKLKVSTKQIEKVPNILLSISYTGVKFIDAETEHKVCEHEIRNIHCACQDAEDLNHFAYITKEHQTNYHYCHVFCAESIDLATEIILTLGQAFEVAYQIALRDKGAKSTKSTQKLKQFLNKCDDRKLSEKGNSDTPPVVKSLVQPDASVSEEEELKISKQIS